MSDIKKQIPIKEIAVKGRSVFSVQITSQGVVVKTAFVTEDGKLLDHPAIFSSPDYAFDQIDNLKKLVSEKFSEAVKMSGKCFEDSNVAIENMKK